MFPQKFQENKIKDFYIFLKKCHVTNFKQKTDFFFFF